MKIVDVHDTFVLAIAKPHGIDDLLDQGVPVETSAVSLVRGIDLAGIGNIS